MNLTWSGRVIKYVLFVFNLLFVITGIILIGVGTSVKAYFTDYNVFLDETYFSLPNLLIAIGSLVFFISFLGCCGAIKESWFMIFVFSILLSLIFILEFSAGVAGYVLRDTTSGFLKDELTKSMKDYEFNSPKPHPITKSWDTIQEVFKCCGAKGPEQWQGFRHTTSSPTTGTTQSSTQGSSSSNNVKTVTEVTVSTTPGDPKLDLPVSCCKSNPGATGHLTCHLNDNSTATYYKQGCVEGFGNYLKEHAVTIGGVGLAICFIQLFGVLFACYLTRQLKHGVYSTG